jgi:autotransporter-associated beta strand protein
LNEVQWDGGGDGISWNDALNWSTDALPGIYDRVIIAVPETITVTHTLASGAVTYIASLHSEENIDLSSGTLSLSAQSTITGTFTLNGGKLDGAGDLTVQGLLNWPLGYMEGTGKTIANGGLIAGRGAVLLGRRLDNATTATIDGGYLNGLGCYSCVLTNLSGALFELRDAWLKGDPERMGIFYNEGQFIKRGRVASALGIPFVNRGHVQILDGRMVFARGYTQEAAGTMVVGIGGPTLADFDRYEITGDVVLSGTLEVRLLNNYEPEIGDSFEIVEDLHVESLTGQFARVNGLTIGNGKHFEVVYHPKGVILEVVADQNR